MTVNISNDRKEVQIGDVVLFVMDTEPSVGGIRPAFVVNKWSAETLNLQVFTDSDTEGRYNDKQPPVMWATSVIYDAEKKPHTWHWKD